jgi:hypothetical protein
MFHIVFESRGAELLTAAMDMDESLDGEIKCIADDYSVGPISDLFSDHGLAERANWWHMVRGTDISSAGNDADTATLSNVVQRMEEEEFDQVWIWMAPNARDICGYYWLISRLKAFSGRVFLISLNNLPFISDKGTVFYPLSLSEIPPREFIKAKKLARTVTPAEFETDPDEWFRLAAENKNLRVLEGGKKIVQYDEDYFDKSLQHFLQPVFQKIPRLTQQYLLKSPVKTNEYFLQWRVKQMAGAGLAELLGESVRLFAKATDDVNSITANSSK